MAPPATRAASPQDASPAAASARPPPPPSEARIRILHFNDVYRLENYPRVRTAVDRHSLPSPHHATVVTLAGDFLAPSLLSTLDGGHGMAACVAASGVTHACLGNHEADIAPGELAQRIRETTPSASDAADAPGPRGFRWINSNLRSLDTALGIKTLERDIVALFSPDGTNRRSVALLGLLSEDRSLYREGAFAGALDGEEPIEPVAECVLREIARLRLPGDLLLPMTHQDVAADLALAAAVDDRGLMPIILGGHDHAVYDEICPKSGTRILKAGSDAENLFVVDFIWDDASQSTPRVEVEMIPSSEFDVDDNVQDLVEVHLRVLEAMENTRLFRIDHFSDSEKGTWCVSGETNDCSVFSTKGNRYRKSAACTAMCTALRKTFAASGLIDCTVLNAGGIRGDKHYEEEWFTFADLKTEFPFPDPCTVVEIPGSVLQNALAHSRKKSTMDPSEEDSGLLHLCDNVEYDDERQKIVRIAGASFDEDRKYRVALPVALLNGLDDNIPLMEWVAAAGIHLDEDSGVPIKVLFMEFFVLAFWADVGRFTDMDSDGDGLVSADDFRQYFRDLHGSSMSDVLVDNVLAIADLNQRGSLELIDVLCAQMRASEMLHGVDRNVVGDLSGGTHRGTPVGARAVGSRRQGRPTTLLNSLAKFHMNQRCSLYAKELADSVKELSRRRSSINWHKSLPRGSLVDEEELS